MEILKSCLNRRVQLRLFCFLLATGAALFLLAFFAIHEQKAAFSACNMNLQNGDLVFIRCRTWRSFIIRFIDNMDDYSHVGIVRIVNGVPNVIHASPEAEVVQLESLVDFMSPTNAEHSGVYRLKDSQLIAEAASLSAWNYFERKTSFDYKFDIKHDNALYCTELIWRAYEQAGIDLSVGEEDFLYDSAIYGKVLMPARLSRCRYLVKIEEGIH